MSEPRLIARAKYRFDTNVKMARYNRIEPVYAP